MPTYSVIIPAYNCERTIENTVNSVLASGLENFEVIIIDDGSKDGTAAICDKFCGNFDNIRVIHQANAGVSAARNAGIKAAKGDYVVFVDSDDTVDAEKLSELIKLLKADSSIDMAIYGISFDYYHNKKLYRRDELLPPEEGTKSIHECGDMLYELFENNCLSSLCNRIVKRSIIANSGLLLREDMFLYEDLEFSLRVMNRCENILLFPQVIYHYKQSDEGSNACHRLKKISHIYELVDKIEQALNPIDSEKSKILLSLYLTLAGEKISVSEREDIETVCDDFRQWIDSHKLLPMIENREYAMMIYNGQVSALIYKRAYTKLRHSVANWIKQNIGDFRKWKFV